MNEKSTAMASQLESQAGVDLVPGTEVMTDYVGTSIQHASSEKKVTVLVPQPSNDPHDPLVSRFQSGQPSLLSLRNVDSETCQSC
jgi:hypothetical protein